MPLKRSVVARRPGGDTAFPKLHFVSLLDPISRRIIADVVIGRHDQREREALVQMLRRLGE